MKTCADWRPYVGCCELPEGHAGPHRQSADASGPAATWEDYPGQTALEAEGIRRAEQIARGERKPDNAFAPGMVDDAPSRALVARLRAEWAREDAERAASADP